VDSRVSRVALKHSPAQAVDVFGPASRQEAGAQHEVVLPLAADHYQGIDIFDPVLPVGVKGNHVAGIRPAHRVADAGLQRGSLAQVGQVAQDGDRELQGSLDGVVTAAIVDHHNMVKPPAQALEHLRDDLPFVIGRDDDPDI